MFNLISTAHAMASQPGANGQGGGGLMGMLLPMALVFGIFYFMMIRPQQKQAKKMRAMIEALKRGDEIVTRSGIHAKIHGMADNVLTLEIAENVKIKMNKDQVAFVKQAMSAATAG